MASVFKIPNDLDIILVAEKICVKFRSDIEWEKFGMYLLCTKDNQKLIAIRQNNQGNSLKEKCRDLLNLWKTESKSSPNWEQVIQALKKDVATELETALNTDATCTNHIDEHHTHDDQVGKQGLEQVLPFVTAQELATDIPSIGSDIMNKKPHMFELGKIVIPNILNNWECIAEAFYYDIATITAIKDKEHGDPRKCCREFFKDWLTTNRGSKAGPKVWLTLFDRLKEVDEISTDIIEEMIAKVKQLKQ